MLDGLLILSPHNLLIAAVNYGCIHAAYKLSLMAYEKYFSHERKEAIKHHFAHGHETHIDDCREQKCAML